MHLVFLGFGLIAGSIAKAVRANPLTAGWTMAAWSPSGDGPVRARDEGILDLAAESPEAALARADIIVLAAPASRCLDLIDHLAGPWRAAWPASATITDVASTKAAIVARADAAGLRFVGGHPMAGSDLAGFAASEPDLFAGRPWVLVPGVHAAPPDVEQVAMLVDVCRGVVVRLDAADHDRAVAAISHLPLVVAAALAEAVSERRGDWPTAASLAAGGWRDTTRVARGDPSMGAAILATNAPEVAARLRDLRAVIDAWLAELEPNGGPDEMVLRDRLAAARAALVDRT
jgi:prephenate dehydrogenase